MKEDTTPTRWSDATLDQMRKVTDPVADRAIKEIMKKGDEALVNSIFLTLRDNVSLKREDLPSELHDFFEEASKLPDWADPELLKKGAAYFGEHAVEFAMLLYFVSLPMAYSSARGAAVLTATGRLEKSKKDGSLKKFSRRLMETAQFVFYVGMKDAFAPEGKAISAAMKVRLMHAIIRYYIKRRGQWDVEVLGEPINQEDMTGTMLSFCSLIYDAMDQLKLTPQPEMQAAHFHSWKVMGHLMGVSPEMMPKDMAEGNALGWQILRRNRAASPDGKALTSALIGYAQGALPRLFNHLPAVFIRYYCGDKIADILGVPKYGWFWSKFLPHFIGWFIRKIDSASHVSSFIARISARLQRRFLQHTIDMYFEFRNVEFELPEGLRTELNLLLGSRPQ